MTYDRMIPIIKIEAPATAYVHGDVAIQLTVLSVEGGAIVDVQNNAKANPEKNILMRATDPLSFFEHPSYTLNEIQFTVPQSLIYDPTYPKRFKAPVTVQRIISFVEPGNCTLVADNTGEASLFDTFPDWNTVPKNVMTKIAIFPVADQTASPATQLPATSPQPSS